MRLIVAGSRRITSYQVVSRAIDRVRQSHEVTEIVCGDARGVDSLGRRYAQEHGIRCVTFKPDWDKHGKSAGYLRNAEMGDYADGVLAVWDGVSRGTAHMIGYMRNKQKYVAIWKHIVRPLNQMALLAQ
jgi:hypothetical protein